MVVHGGGGEEWLDADTISKVETVGFTDSLDEGCWKALRFCP